MYKSLQGPNYFTVFRTHGSCKYFEKIKISFYHCNSNSHSLYTSGKSIIKQQIFKGSKLANKLNINFV